MTEAVAQLQRGIELLASVPNEANYEQHELELQVALVPALIATKGHSASEVGETVVRARVIAEKLDRSDYLVGLLYGESNFRLFRAEFRLALSDAQNLEQIGQTRNDRAAQLLGHHMHGVVRHWLGQFVAARALFERCQDLQDPAHRAVHAAITAGDPYAAMLIYLAMTLTFLGYIDQGRRRMNEAVSEARRLGHAHTLAEVLAYAGVIEQAAVSPGRVQRYAQETVALAQEHGFPTWWVLGTVQHGWSLAALGQGAEGINVIKEGRLTARAMSVVLGKSYVLALLAEAYARATERARGLSRLTQAVEFVEATEERSFEAELHRLRGDLLNETGEQSAAEESYHCALAVARRQSAKTFELRAATSLARLWRDQGKRTEARDLLAPIYGWFTEGFGTPVLRDAEALLDTLDS
jgi:predicted ATPase